MTQPINMSLQGVLLQLIHQIFIIRIEMVHTKSGSNQVGVLGLGVGEDEVFAPRLNLTHFHLST